VAIGMNTLSEHWLWSSLHAVLG